MEETFRTAPHNPKLPGPTFPPNPDIMFSLALHLINSGQPCPGMLSPAFWVPDPGHDCGIFAGREGKFGWKHCGHLEKVWESLKKENELEELQASSGGKPRY